MPDRPTGNNESDRYYDRYQRYRDFPPEIEMPTGDMDALDEGTGQRIQMEDDALPSPEVSRVQRLNDQHEEQLESRTAEPVLESVPDADTLFPNSPVDPAAPDPDAPHGTDLINGAGRTSTS